MLLVYVLLAVWVSPTMTAVVAALGGGVFLALRPRLTRARARGRQTTQLGGRLYAAISEHLAGMKISKSFGAETRNLRHFNRTIGDLRAVSLDYRIEQADTRLWFALGSVTVFSVVMYVAVEVLRVPGAELVILMLLFSRMMPRVSGLMQSYQQVTHMVPAFESYRDWMTRAEVEAEAYGKSAETRAPRSFSRDIRLSRVSFRYRETPAEPVLRDVDLCIEANRTTAIVGPSGAGKSTLADVLMGLLTPDSGVMRVDGEPLTGESLPAWRLNIGYVPQDTFLFHDTVRANLCWVRPAATEDDVWNALETAAADEFVRRLPTGLDTEIGDRCVRLSGGERQRLALARARALIVTPGLLILDEATSHLDTENEHRIQTAIEGLHGRLTVVVIAHRLSTVRNADQIVVMERGSVVETGSWDVLNDRMGRFSELVRAQDPVDGRV